MKRIEVTIKAEFEIPDDWEIVDYDDGDPDYPLKTVKSKDGYNTFTFQVLKENKRFDCFSSGNDEYANAWSGLIQTEDCDIVEIKK